MEAVPPSDPAVPRPLARPFYAHGAERVARDLLGKTLVRDLGGTMIRCRITETEAYIGSHDRASHARFGKTQRNKSMFGPAGTAYVFLVYGLHHLLNVVCSAEDDPQAVLLRAAVPLDGWSARLGGPALLGDALGVNRDLDGHDLRKPPLWIEEGPAPAKVGQGPRVGVEYAGPWARRRLRFWDPSDGVKR